MTNRIFPQQTSKQAGVVLITSLIFLVILTLIVLAVLRSGTLEERMAANARNRQLALQAAEAVVRDGEVTLFSTALAAPIDPFVPSGFTAACTNGFCVKPKMGDNPAKWSPKSFDWSSNTVTRTFKADGSKLTDSLVASQPTYVVQLYSSPVISPSAGGGICPTVLYRITARGVGRDASEVFLQTTYRSQPQYC